MCRRDRVRNNQSLFTWPITSPTAIIDKIKGVTVITNVSCINSITDYMPSYVPYRQEDAHEFFIHLQDAMERSRLRTYQVQPVPFDIKSTNIISRIYEGEYKYTSKNHLRTDMYCTHTILFSKMLRLPGLVRTLRALYGLACEH